MSWATHNPEAWDEIERKAVVDWFTDTYTTTGKTIDLTALPDIVLALQEAHPEIFRAIMTYGAFKYVPNQEADYHGSQIDAVMNSAR